jgi:hypothetical protein
MQIFINITNNDLNLNTLRLRNWLNEHSKKWILGDFSKSIYLILTTNNYNRLANAVMSLKLFILKDLKCEEPLHFSKSFLKSKTINNENDFGKIFKSYFLSDSSDIESKDAFNNIVLKGYSKKYIINLFKNNQDGFDPDKRCSFCSKEFGQNFNRKRHEQKCPKKNNIMQSENKNEDNEKNEGENPIALELINKINDFQNDIKNMQTMLQNLTNNTPNNTINSNNNINSNNTVIQNIQINNLTKKEKLNFYLKDMLDIETFTKNYKDNKKYHLTHEEAEVLLENSENSGMYSYADGLYTY